MQKAFMIQNRMKQKCLYTQPACRQAQNTIFKEELDDYGGPGLEEGDVPSPPAPECSCPWPWLCPSVMLGVK